MFCSPDNPTQHNPLPMGAEVPTGPVAYSIRQKPETEIANMRAGGARGVAPLHPIPFNDVREPGAYVICDHGMLVRVPAEALMPARYSGISIAAERPVMVERVSDDPWIPIAAARRLAAMQDLPVAF
jgi:hypothetical protein